MTGFINLDNEFYEGYRYENFEISPYYRLYFQRRRAHNSGFFVQPFLSLTSGEDDYYRYYNDFDLQSVNSDYVENDFFGLAGGAVIGFKWVNQKRYTFEIHAGVGRYFDFKSDSDAYRGNTAYPRINFAIGRRF